MNSLVGILVSVSGWSKWWCICLTFKHFCGVQSTSREYLKFYTQRLTEILLDDMQLPFHFSPSYTHTLSHLWCSGCRATWWKREHIHPVCVCTKESGKRVPCENQKLLHWSQHNKKWQHCRANCDWTHPGELWSVHLWLGERWFTFLHTILCGQCYCTWCGHLHHLCSSHNNNR